VATVFKNVNDSPEGSAWLILVLKNGVTPGLAKLVPPVGITAVPPYAETSGTLVSVSPTEIVIGVELDVGTTAGITADPLPVPKGFGFPLKLVQAKRAPEGPALSGVPV
jgi:hypothetical protein